MAQIGDFFARLVSAGGTRGLSGDADRVLPAEPVFAFFNDRLRKHHTTDDFVADPELLWSTQTFLSRRGGLEAHLRAERGDGVAGFSDILVVINPHDWRRSLRLIAEPWAAAAAHRMRTRFELYCEDQDFHRLFPQRPMGVRIVEDGGLEMGGESIGLGKGEFVTGLLPNFYAGAHTTSRPVVAFHLNIPGAWTGYREVGRLYSDQVLFTLGSHWLENFRHPRLQLPALYRLQQFSDGSFIHVINPEAIGDVLIHEQQSNGATVLTLQHISGSPLAHLVLALLDGETPQTEPGAGAWTGAACSSDQSKLDDLEAHTDGTAPVVPNVFQQSRTVVPAEVGARLLTLQEHGVLLQRVHFARFMSGYDVFIGPGGEVGTALEAPSATLQVRPRSVSVVAHIAEVLLDDRPLVPGRPVRLTADAVLTVGGTRLELTDLSNIDLPQWPYLLEIRRQAGTSHLVFGRAHRVGRDPRCSVRLPDEPHNGNIVWRSEVARSRVIRSRNGEIPKSRFYIDSIMVASEHAEIDLTAAPLLRGRARDCYSYVRRAGELLPIVPTRMTTGSRELLLEPRDEVLIGNCVFQVGWSDAGTASGKGVRTAGPLDSVVDQIQTEEPLTQTRQASPSPGAPSAPTLATTPPPMHAAAPMMMHTEPPPLPQDVALGTRPTPGPIHTIEDFGAPTLSELVETPSARLEPQNPPPTNATDGSLPAIARPEHSSPDAPSEDASPDTTQSAHAETTPNGVPTLAEFDLKLSAGPSEAPLSPSAVESTPEVVIIDEGDWQLELARPARLVTQGWMVTGKLSVGNHRGCAVVLPENRVDARQVFAPKTFAHLKIRGSRGHVELVSTEGVTLLQAGETTSRADSLDDIVLQVPRLDADGDSDFQIELRLVSESDLPDPRAQMLRLNGQDPMVAGLFTMGLPLNSPRVLRLGPISATASWDGQRLQLTGYLRSYRKDDGSYHPFFIRSAHGQFETVPEDGRRLSLAPKDTLLCGMTWFVFETRPS